MKKGIIFDLDGTLWNVTDVTYKCCNIVTKKYNLREITKETVCKVFGKNREESARLYFPYLDVEVAIRYGMEISKLIIGELEQYGGVLYPKIKETLDILKNDYTFYIVSNSGNIKYVEAFLNTSGVKNYFTDYIAASYLNISKEDAIKKIINDHKIEKAVYVGDTFIDLNASRNAHIPFIYAKYGFEKNLESEYFINEFSELPYVLKDIFK